jgi:hypothetical protein
LCLHGLILLVSAKAENAARPFGYHPFLVRPNDADRNRLAGTEPAAWLKLLAPMLKRAPPWSVDFEILDESTVKFGVIRALPEAR